MVDLTQVSTQRFSSIPILFILILAIFALFIGCNALTNRASNISYKKNLIRGVNTKSPLLSESTADEQKSLGIRNSIDLVLIIGFLGSWVFAFFASLYRFNNNLFILCDLYFHFNSVFKFEDLNFPLFILFCAFLFIFLTLISIKGAVITISLSSAFLVIAAILCSCSSREYYIAVGLAVVLIFIGLVFYLVLTHYFKDYFDAISVATAGMIDNLFALFMTLLLSLLAIALSVTILYPFFVGGDVDWKSKSLCTLLLIWTFNTISNMCRMKIVEATVEAVHPDYVNSNIVLLKKSCRMALLPTSISWILFLLEKITVHTKGENNFYYWLKHLPMILSGWASLVETNHIIANDIEFINLIRYGTEKTEKTVIEKMPAYTQHPTTQNRVSYFFLLGIFHLPLYHFHYIINFFKYISFLAEQSPDDAFGAFKLAEFFQYYNLNNNGFFSFLNIEYNSFQDIFTLKNMFLVMGSIMAFFCLKEILHSAFILTQYYKTFPPPANIQPGLFGNNLSQTNPFFGSIPLGSPANPVPTKNTPPGSPTSQASSESA